MKPLIGLALLLVGATACSGADGTLAVDPAPSSVPVEAPAAPGRVSTRGLVTILDDGDGAQFCVGAIAASLPPQCAGPELLGWDWETTGQGMFETQDEVRWGSFSVTGTWDGTAMTVEDAIPAALYDAMVPEPTSAPAPSTAYSSKGLRGIIETLRDEVPWFGGAHVLDGHVLVDVVYDDGSLQAWADEEYGAGVVLVNSALADQG